MSLKYVSETINNCFDELDSSLHNHRNENQVIKCQSYQEEKEKSETLRKLPEYQGIQIWVYILFRYFTYLFSINKIAGAMA